MRLVVAGFSYANPRYRASPLKYAPRGIAFSCARHRWKCPESTGRLLRGSHFAWAEYLRKYIPILLASRLILRLIGK